MSPGVSAGRGNTRILWFTPVILAFFLYFATRNLKSRSIWFLVGMWLGWSIDLCAFLLYITNHNYYYFVVSRYFSISPDIRRMLSELDIPLEHLTRAMNIGSAAIIFSALCFALSYSLPAIRWKYYTVPLCIPIMTQLVLFDPVAYEKLYLFVTRLTDDFSRIEEAKAVILAAMQVFNRLCLLASVTVLCMHLWSCKIKVIRLINSCVAVSFACFLFIFYFIFRDTPRFWVNVTTVSSYVSYNALDVASNSVLMRYFPYVCLAGVLVTSFALYRYSSVESGYRHRQLRVSADLRQFSAGFAVISHSLKNQLLCIEEEACQLREKTERPEELVLGIEAIQRISQEMFNSITYLNTRIRIQRFELSLISLGELCGEIIRERAYIPESILFVSTMPKEDIRCYAARRQLKECILNLLANAVDAVGGEEPRISFSLERSKSWAVLTVSDNGCGISREEQTRIFQPFYSTKSSAKSWGIGLSVCSQVIEAHGGKLLLSSEPGEGSTFQILLSTVY